MKFINGLTTAEVERRLDEVKEALEEAIDLISSEYCSHGPGIILEGGKRQTEEDRECRADLLNCYCRKQIAALAALTSIESKA